MAGQQAQEASKLKPGNARQALALSRQVKPGDPEADFEDQGAVGGLLDEDGKREMLGSHLSLVRAYVRWRLQRFGRRGFQAVDDVGQDTILRALQKDAPAERVKFEGWLTSNASHAVRAWIRAERIGSGREESADASDLDSIGVAPNLEREMELEDVIRITHRILGRLRATDRQILMDFYSREMSVSEMAAGAGRSLEAVRSKLKRSLREAKRRAKRAKN